MRYMFLVTQTKGGQPPQALFEAMEEARKKAVSDGGPTAEEIDNWINAGRE